MGGEWRSKVILTGLPPSITEEHLRDLLQVHTAHCRSVNFIPGTPPNRHDPLSTAIPANVILDFTDPDALLRFNEQWNGKETKEGDLVFTTSINFFPLQRHFEYDSRVKREEARLHGVERLKEMSAGFREFIKQFEPAEDGDGDGPDKEPTRATGKSMKPSDSFITEKDSERIKELMREAGYDGDRSKQKTPLMEYLEKRRPSVSDSKPNNTAGNTNGKDGNGKPKEKKKNNKKSPKQAQAVPKEKEPAKKYKLVKNTTAKSPPPSNNIDNHPPTSPSVALPDGCFYDSNPSNLTIYDVSSSPPSTTPRPKRKDQVDQLRIYDLSLRDKPHCNSGAIRGNPNTKTNQPLPENPQQQQQQQKRFTIKKRPVDANINADVTGSINNTIAKEQISSPPLSQQSLSSPATTTTTTTSNVQNDSKPKGKSFSLKELKSKNTNHP